jgi:hypothetical protein
MLKGLALRVRKTKANCQRKLSKNQQSSGLANEKLTVNFTAAIVL